MWQETKHGLYKQFVFHDFQEAWNFMQQVAESADHAVHHLRWQNDWNVVDIWLGTNDAGVKITDTDHQLAQRIDDIVMSQNNPHMDKAVDKKSTIITEVQVYADGGSRGNPGPSASGYVVLDMEDRVVLHAGEYIGVTTNNQAEYQALKLGLEHALHDFQARNVHVYMDSMLVVNQMKNIFKIKNRELWPIHNACVALAKNFDKITFDHVPRELNKLADGEVNAAMDNVLHEPQ